MAKNKSLQVPSPYLPFCLITIITHETPYFNKIGLFREFRDKILLKRLGGIGRFVVKSYYKLSLKLASFVKIRIVRKFLLIFLIKPVLDFYSAARE
jgi:hypothetical protein